MKVVEYIESLLNRFGGEDPLYFSLKLIELMLESKLGDPQRYARLAEAMMEARLRAAMRELNRHRHLVPQDVLKKNGYTATLRDDGRLPFTR